ncbi:MAG: helix-turn-helix transcriptional regulator [Planctomycetes bacterium]|nr:helix-turn-helix transcriptional regulator [Planctomycetota bacterium]
MTEFISFRTRKLAPERFFEALANPRVNVRIAGCSRSTTYKGWVVQRRMIPEHLVYLLAEHGVEGRVAGKPVRLDPGCFVWVMPGAAHEFRVLPGRAEFVVYYMKLTAAERGDDRCLRLTQDFVFAKNAQALQPYYEALLDEARAPMAYGEARRRSLLALLFSGALRLAAGPEGKGPVFDDRQRRMLAEFMQAHAAKRPAPSDLAAELRLNPDYFARVFQRTFGVSPRAWILRERMRVAAMRLSDSNLGVSELAYALGYKDVFLFSRQFKQVFGRSPRAYRRGT